MIEKPNVLEIEQARRLLESAGWSVKPPRNIGQPGVWECPGCGRSWRNDGVVICEGNNPECSVNPIFTADGDP